MIGGSLERKASRRVGLRWVGPRWGSERWEAQNFALFIPSPATISFFLLSLGCLLVEFWWCLKRLDGVLGLSCEAPAAPKLPLAEVKLAEFELAENELAESELAEVECPRCNHNNQHQPTTTTNNQQQPTTTDNT